VASIAAPVQFIGGWYDILLPWMLEDFESLQRLPAFRRGAH
jgi:hypothetical protein